MQQKAIPIKLSGTSLSLAPERKVELSLIVDNPDEAAETLTNGFTIFWDPTAPLKELISKVNERQSKK